MKGSGYIKFIPFFIIGTMLLFQECTSKKVKEGVIISGIFSKFPDRELMVNEIRVGAFSWVESLRTDEQGRFTINLDFTEPGIYQLKIDNKNYITLILYPGDRIKVISSNEQITYNYRINGSEESSVLGTYEKYLDQHMMKIKDYMDSHPTQGSIDQKLARDTELRALYDSLKTDYKETTSSWIKNNPKSFVNLIIINRRFGLETVFEDEKDFDILALIDSALYTDYHTNMHVKSHHVKVKQIKYKMDSKKNAAQRLAPGRKAPPLELENINGKTIPLRSFEGKIVLLYFWSASKYASREINRELKSIYDEYKSQGLTIYAVSTDVYIHMWKEVVKREKFKWINVHEGTDRKSAVNILYQLPKKMPFFYLLDEEQKIITRSGEFDIIKDELVKIMEN